MTYNTTCRYFVHPWESPPSQDTNRACHGLLVQQFMKRWTIKSTIFWAPPSTPSFQVRGILTTAILPLTPCSLMIEILDVEKLLPKSWYRLSYCSLKKLGSVLPAIFPLFIRLSSKLLLPNVFASGHSSALDHVTNVDDWTPPGAAVKNEWF